MSACMPSLKEICLVINRAKQTFWYRLQLKSDRTCNSNCTSFQVFSAISGFASEEKLTWKIGTSSLGHAHYWKTSFLCLRSIVLLQIKLNFFMSLLLTPVCPLNCRGGHKVKWTASACSRHNFERFSPVIADHSSLRQLKVAVRDLVRNITGMFSSMNSYKSCHVATHARFR